MLTQTRYLYSRLSPLMDLILCGGAFFLAHHVRNTTLAPALGDWLGQSALDYYLPLLILFPPMAVLCWRWNHVYRLESLFYRRRLARGLALGAVEAVGLFVLLRFFFSAPQTDPYTGALIRDSRGQVLLYPALATLLVWGRFELARWWLTRRRLRGQAAAAVLVVGSGDNLRRFLDAVLAHPFWGYRIEGLISDHDSLAPGERVRGYPVVARAEELAAVLEKQPVDEVIFVPGLTPLDDLTPCLTDCETMGICSRLSLNFFAQRLDRTSLDAFEGMPVVTYHTVQEVNGYMVAKWMLDRVVAAVALVVLAPALAAIALAVAQSGGGGALFRQRRVGRNGRQFWMYKFRTMRPGAENEIDTLQGHNEVDGPRFKMALDPRITPLGRTLRRYWIDELPQLWNVLWGDMSLVGPRPPLPEEVARYTRPQRRRVSMKPGLTGLATIRGGARLSWDAYMEADLEYIDRWSFWLDLRILAATIPLILRGKGQ